MIVRRILTWFGVVVVVFVAASPRLMLVFGQWTGGCSVKGLPERPNGLSAYSRDSNQCCSDGLCCRTAIG